MFGALPDELTTEILSYLEFKHLAKMQSDCKIWYELGKYLKWRQAPEIMNQLNVTVREIHNNLEQLYKKLVRRTIRKQLSPPDWKKISRKLIKLSSDKNGLKEFKAHLQGYLDPENEAHQSSLTEFNEHHEQINMLVYQCIELLKK